MVIAIFNGIHYPFAVSEEAITWAKKSGEELKGIFLVATEKDEGYGFPSDLDTAQELETTNDANKADENIINANIRTFTHAAAIAGVVASTSLVKNPGEELIKTLLQPADTIIYSSRLNEFYVAAVNDIDWRSVFASLPAKLVEV